MYPSRIRLAIEKYLEDRPDEVVFLRSEFDGCGGSRSGIDKTLRSMVEEGKFLRVGYGAYAKSSKRVSVITGNIVVATDALTETCAAQLLRKLGVDPQQDSATREYNEGKSTQVPAWLAFDVGKARISRRISFGERQLYYERSTR